MDFRWIAGITLWTMLSGPVLIHWSMAIPRPNLPARPAVERLTRPEAAEADRSNHVDVRVDVPAEVDLVDAIPIVLCNDVAAR